MKKILFLIALFTLMGGVNSYATKKYASFSVAVGCSWNSGTNTMSFTEVNGWQILLTALPSGNISSYATLHATLSDMSDNIDNIRLRIKDTSDNYADYNLVSGENNIDLASLAAANPSCNFESISDITIWSPTSAAAGKTVDGENAASVVITDCYMEKPFVFAFDATGTAIVDVTDLQSWGCLSLNPQTGVVTNSYAEPDNKNGYLRIAFPSAVDMSSVYGFKVNYDGDEILNGISVNDWRYKFGTNIYGRKDIAANMAEETSIEAWIWGAKNATGSMTITSVEFYSSVIAAIPGENAPMSGLTNYHKDGEMWQTTGYTPNYRINESTNAAYFGVDWNGEKCEYYSDVEGYKAIRIYSSGENTPRAMFFNSTASGQQAFNFTWNANGYYELLLSDVYASVSNYKLISIRPASGTTSSVSGIYMVVDDPIYDYVISGHGVMSPSVADALADGKATSYDATGVTGTGVDFTGAANPNALFIANSGVLANTNNVIVSDECASLVLTDGYPFKAPADFTATAATYTTTINETAKAGTLCLPFAAAIPDGVKAYTLNYTTGNAAAKATEVTSTIPANTPVLLNGSGSATFTGASVDIDADALNVSGALTGVFKTTIVPRGSYVLQNGDEDLGFYLVDSDDIEASPFRAYMTADEAGARSIEIDYEVTGISTVNQAKAAKTGKIYNLNGQIVSKPTKGLFIVDGKVVSF